MKQCGRYIKNAGLIARGHIEIMLDVGVVGHPHVALPFVIAVVGAVKAPGHASLLALLSISTTWNRFQPILIP